MKKQQSISKWFTRISQHQTQVEDKLQMTEVLKQNQLREDSFIDFVRRNVPGTFGGGGVGVLLLDVSVKMEIIDFLQPRIKQKLRENIIITPEKCVKCIDYVQLQSPFARMILGLGGCFGPGPFALDTVIETTIRGSFWS